MAALTGKKPKDTYKDLLQVSNSNAGIDSTLRFVSDGEGTASILKLSTTTVEVAGDITATGTVFVEGDTAAGDDAAIGYTSAEGIIITGQGSTNDITVKNDADAAVLVIPTGTTNVDIVGVATAATFEPDGDTSSGDNAAIGYTSAEGIIVTGQGSTNDVTVKNDADADVITIATGTTSVDIVGDVTAATLNADGDTSASDNAAIGYTSAEGIIITGQGSTNDVTIKNDADADVITIATGTTNVDVVGDLTAGTVNADGDTSAGDDAAMGYTSGEGVILTGQGSTNDVTIKNDADSAVISIPTGTTNVTIAGDLTISGDDLVMGTNTSGAALIADGTNFNPVVISGDAAIATNGALTIADNAVSLAKMAGLARGKLIYGDSSGDPAALAVGSASNVLQTDGTDASWGTVATAGVADNAITLAKMAGLVRGKIIYGDASGDPAALTVGSNGYFLKSDGTDIAWAAATSAAISSYTNSGDNRVITSVDSSTVNGEANLSFDGSVLAVTGNVTATGTVEPAGDTAASDNAAIGYTSTEGIIITGQGSTNDVTIKNDADADVLTIPTGTTNVSIAGNVSLSDASSVNISTPLLAGADHTYTGLSAQMLAGGAISAFDLVCIHTTTQEVVEADASSYTTARVIGIAPAAISDTATGTILLHGFIRDDTWAWTTGSTLYASETAGAMTHTAPSTDGAFVVVIGVALSPDVVYINPSMDVIEHA